MWVEVIWFLSLLIKKKFLPKYYALGNWIKLTECATFKMAQYTKVKRWATDKTLLLNTHYSETNVYRLWLTN